MIPLFPKFKKLELKDKKEIENFTKQFPPYSDYNFTSMWCYNTEDKMRIAWLNGNLVVRFQDYITGELFYSFFGIKKIIKTTHILLEYAQKQGIKSILRLIPEIIFTTTPNIQKFFLVKKDKDHFDYILSIKDLLDAKGKKYSNYRKLARKFNQSYNSCICKMLNIKDKRIAKEIISLFKKWAKKKKKTSKEIEYELEPIQRILRCANVLKVYAIGIYDKDVLIAILIYELTQKKYVISHFVKADVVYKGIYQVLRDYFVKHVFQTGYKWLNIEQDLGISTLRFTKEQWNPAHYLKKNNITYK